jgi:hypothetical protein
MKTLLTASVLALATACTTPAPEPPGIEEQPKSWHYDRNPAQLPTTSAPTDPMKMEDPATMPVQDPMSEGTVRTPRYVDEALNPASAGTPRPAP